MKSLHVRNDDIYPFSSFSIIISFDFLFLVFVTIWLNEVLWSIRMSLLKSFVSVIFVFVWWLSCTSNINSNPFSFACKFNTSVLSRMKDRATTPSGSINNVPRNKMKK